MTKQVTPRYAREVGTASWSAVFKARKNGADWDELKTDTGLSALGRAVVDNEYLIVEELLKLGAPPIPVQLFNQNWFSPLWASLEREESQILYLLLKYNANPNESHLEQDELKPLHYASSTRQIESTLFLCQFGAQVDGLDNPNSIPSFEIFEKTPTPIHRWVKQLASNFDDIRPFMELLQKGANPTLPAPPHQNLWALVQSEWKMILAQKNNHPQVGVALSLLEKKMLEWETPSGKEGKGSKRL